MNDPAALRQIVRMCRPRPITRRPSGCGRRCRSGSKVRLQRVRRRLPINIQFEPQAQVINRRPPPRSANLSFRQRSTGRQREHKRCCEQKRRRRSTECAGGDAIPAARSSLAPAELQDTTRRNPAARATAQGQLLNVNRIIAKPVRNSLRLFKLNHVATSHVVLLPHLHDTIAFVGVSY